MSQIRRKRAASDRKPLGRFLSWTSERTGIPEDGEAAEAREEKPSSGVEPLLPGWRGEVITCQVTGVRLCFRRRGRRRLGSDARFPAEAGEEGRQQEPEPGPL